MITISVFIGIDLYIIILLAVYTHGYQFHTSYCTCMLSIFSEPCSLITSGIPHLFQYQNSCYGLLTNSRIDYSEAVAYCQERGAELATLESEEEFLFIRTVIIDNS